MTKLKIILCSLVFGVSVVSGFSETIADRGNRPVPTHGDAAVILAKYSGLFDGYISKGASLNECVAFLNQHGVYFGLLEVVSGNEFTLHDCARAMGQIELVFTGEAEYLAGKVLLPKGIDTWEDFCIMNGVEYRQGYEAIIKTLISARQLND